MHQCEPLESRRLLNAAMFLDRHYSVGIAPRAIAAADFNQDGRLDVFTANGYPGSGVNSLSVALGQADGTIGAATTWSVTREPNKVIAINLDRLSNNTIDVVVANADGTLTALYNDGHGAFTSATTNPLGSSANGLATADFNRDGNPDLAVSVADTSGVGTISIQLGNGLTSLIAGPTIVCGTQIGDVVAGDFNGDGKSDVATVDGSGNRVFVALGNGAGAFAAATSFAAGGSSYRIATADLNHDGKLDLVTAQLTAATVSVLMGAGNGAFGAPTTYSIGPTYVSAIAVDDFDGDGNMDVVASVTNSTPRIALLRGVGNGALMPQSDANSALIGPNPGDILAGDFNGDGKLDVASVGIGYTGNPLNVLCVTLGNGDGTFASPRWSESGGPAPVVIVPVELNGDGLIDLVVCNRGTASTPVGHTVAIVFGAGNGRFGAPTLYEVGNGPSSAVVADINEDGKLDVIVTCAGTDFAPNNKIVTLLGQGGGTFANGPVFTVSPGPTSLNAADVNGDGHLDLVYVDFGSFFGQTTTFSVMLGAGDASFSTPVAVETGARIGVLVLRDFDGDLKPDIVLTQSANGGVIRTYHGVGDGTFQNTFTLSNIIAGALTTGDLNGDGAIDLAVTDYNANTVTTVMNPAGNGAFVRGLTMSTGALPARVRIADLNGDGRPDLAAQTYLNNSVSILTARLDGTFNVMEEFGAGGNPNGFATADVNNDGRIDLVCGGVAVAGLITVMINQLGPGYAHLNGSTLAIDAPAGGDAVTIAEANGQITISSATGTFYFNSSAVTGISFNGTPGDDTLTLATSISKPLAIHGGTGSDTLNVNGGTSVVQFAADQTLAHLNIAAGAHANVAPNQAQLLRVGHLFIGGQLDLNDNDLIVTGTPRSTIEAYVRDAYNFGDWLGESGIFSSAAKGNPIGNTTLGLLSGQEFNDNNGGLFNGQAVNNSDVLLKYTYFGDVDFNGQVDVSDYNLIDFGFSTHLTGWANGDADWSGGATDVSDYNLIDFAFATQTNVL